MIIAVLLLLSLGITVIYTSSPTLAIQQIIFSVIGLVFYLLLRGMDYRNLKVIIKPFYLAILVFLVITFIVGIETRGSFRWIPIGPFNFQPSEFAKPILILALAAFWAKHLPTWKNIGLSLLILLPVAALIFKQPDLGTTLTVIFIWMALLVASNISVLKIFTMTSLGLLSLPVAWLGLQEYQKQRIYSFLQPNLDPQGIGFHVIQSTIAVGSGELMGRGLGRGTQSRLQFLPEFRTDFIFAFIAEELGFLGTGIVLLLYAILFFLCLRLLARIHDRFGELIVIGVMGMLLFQITVNIGMNTGILPVTGITLPFLSYGGSSIVTNLISIGLISSVARFGVKRENSDDLMFTLN